MTEFPGRSSVLPFGRLADAKFLLRSGDGMVATPSTTPWFFGIALHGYHAIPPRPASHGCARVTCDAIGFIWANDLMPMGSVVLVYGESPAPAPAV